MHKQAEPWRDEIMPAATRRNSDLRRLWGLALSLPGGTFEAARHCDISQHQMMAVFCGQLPADLLVKAIPHVNVPGKPIASASLLEVRWKNLVGILEGTFRGNIDSASEATNMERPIWVAYLMGLKRISESNARDIEEKLGLDAHGLEVVDGQVALTPEERRSVRASNALRLFHCLETKYAAGKAILDCLSSNKQSTFLEAYDILLTAAGEIACAVNWPQEVEDAMVPWKNKVTVAVCRSIEHALELQLGVMDLAISAADIESIAEKQADKRQGATVAKTTTRATTTCGEMARVPEQR